MCVGGGLLKYVCVCVCVSHIHYTLESTLFLYPQTMRSQSAMAKAMKGVSKAMSHMNAKINLPQLQKIMMDFEREVSSPATQLVNIWRFFSEGRGSRRALATSPVPSCPLYFYSVSLTVRDHGHEGRAYR